MVIADAFADVVADAVNTGEPGWLHTLGQMAGTLLLLELVMVLIVLMALMIALAVGAVWLHNNVVPIVNQYGDKAIQAFNITQRGGDRVAQTVAAFHGRVQGAQTTIRAFLFGRNGNGHNGHNGHNGRTALPPATTTAQSAQALPAQRRMDAALNALAEDEALDGYAATDGHTIGTAGDAGHTDDARDR